MITDPIFYRLFATSPEAFLLVLGMSADSAREMAARYEYEALEFKETAHRVDGVFRPKGNGGALERGAPNDCPTALVAPTGDPAYADMRDGAAGVGLARNSLRAGKYNGPLGTSEVRTRAKLGTIKGRRLGAQEEYVHAYRSNPR